MPLDDFAGAVLAVSFGSYPRVGDTPDEQRLRRALHSLDRGEITADEVFAVERDVTKSVLAEQAAAGVDILTDGLVRWNDPVSHLARELEGVEINGLLRYFDNNFYYRQPVLTGPVRWQRPILLDDLEFAQAASDRPLKAVIPGPLTLAQLSNDGHYGDLRRATLAIAEALNRELQSCQEVDVVYVQVEEPAFDAHTDRGLLRDAYAALAQDVTLPLVLAPFFGDVGKSFSRLFDLELAGYHLDLVSHATNAEALDPEGFPPKTALSLGLLDARNTRLESAGDLARRVEDLRARLPESCMLFVTTNCGLEFLPRDKARAKLRLLAEVRDAAVAARR